MDFNRLKTKLIDSKDQVSKGLGKAGDMAKSRFGHASEIDKGVAAADNYLDSEYAKEHGTTPTTTTSPPVTPPTTLPPTTTPPPTTTTPPPDNTVA
jgi:hypothetical protein